MRRTSKYEEFIKVKSESECDDQHIITFLKEQGYSYEDVSRGGGMEKVVMDMIPIKFIDFETLFEEVKKIKEKSDKKEGKS